MNFADWIAEESKEGGAFHTDKNVSPTGGNGSPWKTEAGTWDRVKEVLTTRAHEAYQGVKDAFTAPKRAMTGEMSRDDMIMEALNTGAFGMMAPAKAIVGVAPKTANVPEGATGVFVGRQHMDPSNTEMMENLKTAKRLRSEGESAKEIWRQTGFFYDEFAPVPQWVREVSDEGVKFKHRPLGTYAFDQLVDHPNADQFTGMKPKIHVGSDYFKNNPHARGSYNPVTNTIALNRAYDDDTLRKTLIHETEHWLSGIDDRSSGLNAAVATQQLSEEMRQFDDFLSTKVAKTTEEKEALAEARKMIINLQDNILYNTKPSGKLRGDKEVTMTEAAVDKWYRLNRGEMGAEDAKDRIDWTDAQRKETPPVQVNDPWFIANDLPYGSRPNIRSIITHLGTLEDSSALQKLKNSGLLSQKEIDRWVELYE